MRGKGCGVVVMRDQKVWSWNKGESKVREAKYLQTASQLYTKQVGTGEINQIIESLLKVNVQRITKTYQIETSEEKNCF